MAKVYVSSTIIDLRPERQAVLDWLRLARHQAVDSYLPDSDTVRDSCLDDVAACDLYVLILGHRYGFQPAEDNPGGLSITHLEFRRAGECGIPRVALLRTSIPDVSLSDLENPARVPLVFAFRARWPEQVRPAEFSDLQGLIQGLEHRDPGPAGQAGETATGQSQVVAGRVLRLAPRPVFLAGREELLAELDARLAGDSGAGPPVVALCGLGGTGKTSVALEYAHRHLGEVRVAWQFARRGPDGAGGRVRRTGRPARRAGPSRRPGPGGRRCTGFWPTSRRRWLLIFDNASDKDLGGAVLAARRAWAGADHQRKPDLAPGQTLELPRSTRRLAAEFPGQPHR